MEKILDILDRLDDEVLAYGELKNDLVFHKIPKDKVSYYITESLRLGEEKGKQYKTSNLIKLCNENDIKVEFVKKSGKFYSVQFRAEINFSKKENIIKIYEDSLIDLMNTYNKMVEEKDKLTYEEVINIHLAHEFYHYLEHRDKKYTNDILEPICTFQLLSFKKEASVLKCSEIAAHKFCKEVLGLKYLPNIYDYIYLIETGEINLTNFNDMITSWKKELIS